MSSYFINAKIFDHSTLANYSTLKPFEKSQNWISALPWWKGALWSNSISVTFAISTCYIIWLNLWYNPNIFCSTRSAFTSTHREADNYFTLEKQWKFIVVRNRLTPTKRWKSVMQSVYLVTGVLISDTSVGCLKLIVWAAINFNWCFMTSVFCSEKRWTSNACRLCFYSSIPRLVW